MKSRLLRILLLLLLVSASLYSQGNIEKYNSSASELKTWTSYLSSDEMKGRQNGSPEMKEAAEWIAQKFIDFDIQPAYQDGQLIRPYAFHTRRGNAIEERNIVGILEGSNPDLKDQFIIISAHFDHVGIREAVDGDSIYNGADDNAAGTCTLLGVAKAIKKNQYKPGRTLLFASVSGEEMGLFGSRHLASEMPLPLSRAYANINFEMTGHSEYLGRNNYYMTGCDFSNLDEVILALIQGQEHHLIDTISGANRLFFMSDNIAFSRIEREGDVSRGIPSGTFATTAFGEHIHTPWDEASLIDFENMAGLVDHFAAMIIGLSHSDQDIVWTNPRFQRIE